jgi:hypothetical protein
MAINCFLVAVVWFFLESPEACCMATKGLVATHWATN